MDIECVQKKQGLILQQKTLRTKCVQTKNYITLLSHFFQLNLDWSIIRIECLQSK